MNTLAGILLGLVFVVESGVWYVRSMAMPAYRSKSIATSNIVMYTTRVLIICYQIILNFGIENGGRLKDVLEATLVGMLVACLGHLLVFYNSNLRLFCWSSFQVIFGRLRLVSPDEYQKLPFAPEISRGNWLRNVVFASALSTIALVLVYIAPQMFATFYPGYRLTLSSVGQAISFLGMVVTLFVLDPALFKMHDEGQIQAGFSLYLMGRLMGLVFAGAIVLLSLIAY